MCGLRASRGPGHVEKPKRKALDQGNSPLNTYKTTNKKHMQELYWLKNYDLRELIIVEFLVMKYVSSFTKSSTFQIKGTNTQRNQMKMQQMGCEGHKDVPRLLYKLRLRSFWRCMFVPLRCSRLYVMHAAYFCSCHFLSLTIADELIVDYTVLLEVHSHRGWSRWVPHKKVGFLAVAPKIVWKTKVFIPNTLN